MSPRPADESPATTGRLVAALAAIAAAGDRTAALQRVVNHACRLTGVPYGALIVVDAQGRPSEMFHHGTEVDALDLTGLAGFPVTLRGQTVGLLYLADPEEGTPLGPDDSALVHALTTVAGYVVDHVTSQAATDRRRVWQNHGAALAGTLQPPFDFAAADRTITDVAMRAAGAEGSTIARLVDGEIVVTAGSGAPSAWSGSEEHQAAVHAALDGTSAETVTGEGHFVLLAPVGTHLSPPAVLAVHFSAAAPPDDFEHDLLREFAEQAALALDRARAFQDREKIALVSDRDRIARDLHDAVIQRLFATGLHLQKSRSMTVDPELRERLTLSMQDLDHTIRAIRDSIFDLRIDSRTAAPAFPEGTDD